MKKKHLNIIYHIPITKARINLGQVARRAHVNKEYFILEKDGIPLVGLMNADELEDYLELKDPKVLSHIRKSYQEYLCGKSRPAEALLAEFQNPSRTTARPARRQKA